MPDGKLDVTLTKKLQARGVGLGGCLAAERLGGQGRGRIPAAERAALSEYLTHIDHQNPLKRLSH